MTYSKRFGNYAFYAGGVLYQWFKLIEKAEDFWAKATSSPEAIEEWLDDYGSISLVNMKTGEIIHSITE